MWRACAILVLNYNYLVWKIPKVAFLWFIHLILCYTRQYSSTMHSACFGGHHEMSVPVGVAPQVNKFEQASIDVHQGCRVSQRGVAGRLLQRRVLYHVIYPMMHVMLPTPSPWTEWLIDRHLWKHYLPATLFAGSKYLLRTIHLKMF